MKITYFFLLSLTATSVYAVPSLNSTTYDYAVAPVSNQMQDSLIRLQNEVAQLKKSVASLKARQDRSDLNQGRRVPTGNSQPIPLQPTGPLAGEKARYDYAYSVFRNGGYDQAIAEFQSIIQTYPTGEYADNSLYWTGEALLKKGDKQRAMQAFDRVISAYPTSPKIPDALLKLGITQYALGNRAKAKEYYDYLIATYPGTPSANAAYTKRQQAGL